MKQYSFKDLSGGFSHPLVGDFIFAGQIGMSQVTIAMAIEKSSDDVASDGAVQRSFIAGDNGTIIIEVQQTSDAHAFFLNWYNTIKMLADNQDVTNWASAAISFRCLLDGSQHIARGVSPSKIPDKVYTAQGQRIAWTFMCADIQSLSA